VISVAGTQEPGLRRFCAIGHKLVVEAADEQEGDSAVRDVSRQSAATLVRPDHTPRKVSEMRIGFP